MPTSRRLLTLLACVAGAGALSAPAALAAPATDTGHGVVLSLGAHTVRLVDRQHRVVDVHVSSTRGLRRGEVGRGRPGRGGVCGLAGGVSVFGRVGRRRGRGAVVRLGDGSTFKLSGGRRPRGRGARAASDVTLNLQGLTAGETLLITIATDAQGNVAITIRVMPAASDVAGGDGGRGGSADQGACGDDDPAAADDGCADDSGDDAADEVDGTVTALAPDGSSLTIAPDDGSAEATYQVDDPSLLDGIAVGDDVAVSLDQDGAVLDVELVDDSSQDPADPGPGDDGGDA
ncbi:MAG: hypothetical protein ACTHOE_08940 [Conexibacter sp.]